MGNEHHNHDLSPFILPGEPPLAYGNVEVGLTPDGRYFIVRSRFRAEPSGGREAPPVASAQVMEVLTRAGGRTDAFQGWITIDNPPPEHLAGRLKTLQTVDFQPIRAAQCVAAALEGAPPGAHLLAQVAPKIAEIVDQIVELAERGEAIWMQPWSAGLRHQSLASRKPYRGLNRLWLAAEAQRRGFGSPYWLTPHQMKQRGGRIWRGAGRTTPIVVTNRGRIHRGVDEAPDHDPAEHTRSWAAPFERVYELYNLDQVEGIEPPPAPPDRTAEREPRSVAEDMVQDYLSREGLKLLHGGDSAAYHWSKDLVTVPELRQFDSVEAYYATLFHELVHSTGHKNRLNRQSLGGARRFGDHAYSVEELTTEMATVDLCHEAGIADATSTPSVAYCVNWARKIAADPALLVRAAWEADRASAYFLGVDAPRPSARDMALDYLRDRVDKVVAVERAPLAEVKQRVLLTLSGRKTPIPVVTQLRGAKDNPERSFRRQGLAPVFEFTLRAHDVSLWLESRVRRTGAKLLGLVLVPLVDGEHAPAAAPLVLLPFDSVIHRSVVPKSTFKGATLGGTSQEITVILERVDPRPKPRSFGWRLRVPVLDRTIRLYGDPAELLTPAKPR